MKGVAVALVMLSVPIRLCGAQSTEGTLTEIAPNPRAGFHYPYFLYLPRSVDTSSVSLLLVTPNNTGSGNDDFTVHEASAHRFAERSHDHVIAVELGMPLLVPVFPRPYTEWQYYTHALDRDAMLLRQGPMKRIDLQLLAMVRDAWSRLARQGIRVDSKFVLDGFSASGSFVNRFTMLHPEDVRASVCGGVNGILMLPLETMDGVELDYPLGIGDFKGIMGHVWDGEETRRVPQFIYMGERDTNDATLFVDAYSKQEKAIIDRCIGKTMMPDRWEKCQEVYRRAGMNVMFKTYEGIGHEINRDVFIDVKAFIKENLRAGR